MKKILLNLSEETYEKIKQEAEYNMRSITAQINFILKEMYLKEEKDNKIKYL